MCALDDLADLFDVNILVFNKQNETGDDNDDDLEWKHRVYRPSYEMFAAENDDPTTVSSSGMHDYVYLSLHKQQQHQHHNEKLKYKWLVPNAAAPLLKKNLLNSLKQDVYFLKTNTNYAYQFLLLDSQCLFNCFGDYLINNNLNLLLFLNFLSECSVHTLTSLRDLNFDDLLLSSEDPNDMINYLVSTALKID